MRPRDVPSKKTTDRAAWRRLPTMDFGRYFGAPDGLMADGGDIVDGTHRKAFPRTILSHRRADELIE